MRTLQGHIFQTLQHFSTKFWHLTTFKGSFREFRGSEGCLRQKLVYNANCQFVAAIISERIMDLILAQFIHLPCWEHDNLENVNILSLK